MYEGLDRGLVEEPDVARGLPRLDSHHHELGVYEPEAVYDDLALDGLDGVDDEGYGPWVEGLERRLGIDVGPRQPAPEAWVGVVPADHHLWPPGLLQHVQHFGLEYGIDGLHANSRTALRHGKDVDANNGEIIDCREGVVGGGMSEGDFRLYYG